MQGAQNGFVLDCCIAKIFLFVHLWGVFGVLQQNLKIVVMMGVQLETWILFDIR